MNPAATATPMAATRCSNCALEEEKLLHHVRQGSENFRRLCTTCVLRLHPQKFCPTCFEVYHPSPPPCGPRDAVTCSKCRSSSHSQCVGLNVPRPYTCPLCVHPKFPIFVLKKVKDLSSEELKGLNGKKGYGEHILFDQRSAKILLAGTKIAAVSMSKAVATLRIEAEDRAREAAITRKRATEALEHVAYLVAKEKLKKEETAALATPSAEVFGLGLARGGVNLAGVPEWRINPNVSGSNIKSPNVNGTTNINGKAGHLNSRMMCLGVVGEERLRRVGIPASVDGPNEVLAALNAVELREGEKLPELKVGNSKVEPPLNDAVAMDIEEVGVAEVKPGLIDGEGIIDDRFCGNETENKSNFSHVHSNGRQAGNVSNDQVLVPCIGDQEKHSEHIQKLNKDGSEK